MMYPKVCAGLWAGVVCFTVASLHADEFIQNLPVPPVVIFEDVLSSTTDTRSFITFFDKFELSLGILTQVKFDFRYDFLLTLDLPAEGGTGSGSAGGPIFINGNGEPPTGGGNGTGGGGAPSTSLPLPFSVIGTYQTDTNLDTFIALFPGEEGTFDFLSTIIASPGAPGVAASMDLLNTSSVVVTYTYTPIPEPGVAGLLAAGSLLALRRRRQS